jgi:hypothetical protein
MTPKEMIEMFTKKALTLREELLKMESEFNTKKEELLKLQGALEALYELERTDKS